MLDGVYFTVLYEPVAENLFLNITIAIVYAEGLNLSVLDISYAYQNNILPNNSVTVYLSLVHIYLD